MNNLTIFQGEQIIPLKENDNGEILVSGRELHEFLEVKTAYKDWFPRMCEYGFSEETDFCSILSESTGGRPSTDHVLKLDMAKELAMIQRTPKGKEARQYFLKVEKAWNSPEMITKRAMEILDRQVKSLTLTTLQQEQIINELQPKASYYDLILQNNSLLSISVIAKDYGMSARSLNKMLHEMGIQYKLGEQWLLYAKYQDKGYTFSKTKNINRTDGSQGSKLHTYWTQKGRLFIYDLLKTKGKLPLIERN